MNGGGSCQHHPDIHFEIQKGSISEEIKPFIMCLVEISGIGPLTTPALTAGKAAPRPIGERQTRTGRIG